MRQYWQRQLTIFIELLHYYSKWLSRALSVRLLSVNLSNEGVLRLEPRMGIFELVIYYYYEKLYVIQNYLNANEKFILIYWLSNYSFFLKTPISGWGYEGLSMLSN